MSNPRDQKDFLHQLMSELLPAVYRARDKEFAAEPSHQSDDKSGHACDAEPSGPLGEFLSIISAQAALLDEDIRRLYDNCFIETCEEWVVPYIGDLIGYQLVLPPVEWVNHNARTPQERPAFFSVRREVANTIRYRRRKGSLALLEVIARDIAGWHARAVEFSPLLAATPSVRYATFREEAFQRGGLANIRDAKALDLVQAMNGACNTMAHTIDVRRIASTQTPGHFNPSHVGLFVCRLKTHSITDAPARSQEENGVPHCYTFSVLGNDTMLFTKPQDEASPTQIAGPLNLPIPIRRRAFEQRGDTMMEKNPGMEGKQESMMGAAPRRAELVGAAGHHASGTAALAKEGAGKSTTQANPEYYGDKEDKKSLFIRVHKWRGSDKDDYDVVAADIIPADLNEWEYQPPRGRVAVDPELGRIAFHPQERPLDVWVSYYYGFAGDVGGGEYKRNLIPCRPGLASNQADMKCYRVRATPADEQPSDTVFPSIQAALAKWKEERSLKAIIEIQDSRVYEEPDLALISLDDNQELYIYAKSGCRPMMRLLDSSTGRAESLHIEGGMGSRLELNGLLIAGRGLEINNCLGELAIIHSTLVPGWDAEEKSPGRRGVADDSKKARGGKPSLSLRAPGVSVVISHSILGPIHIDSTSPGQETQLRIDNSILDASGADEPAICGQHAEDAGVLFLRNTTILGQVHAYIIESADNTIFAGRVQVKRQQVGCIRFCYVPPESRTPRRYHCQPDLVVANLSGEEKVREATRVRPIFTGTRYGAPDYCQLGSDSAVEITTGAEDQAEMGVFHDLFQPSRARALQARLRDYVPGGYESKVLFIN